MTDWLTQLEQSITVAEQHRIIGILQRFCTCNVETEFDQCEIHHIITLIRKSSPYDRWEKTQGVNNYYQKVLDKLEPYKEQIWDDKHMLTIGWEEFVNIMRETTHE